MVSCHLELMGLHDASEYRRFAQGLLRRVCKNSGANERVFCGLNVPNKKPGEDLLGWAGVLRVEVPNMPLCVHYSLKHQRGSGDPTYNFVRFCMEAAELGISRVLLVTGPRGPKCDCLSVLEQLKGRHPCPGRLHLGIAFNACLATLEERAVERERLVRKLRTGLVGDVWLNCGSDVALLEEGISFARAAHKGLNLQEPMTLFGSVLRPNQPQLQQMRDRPWNGVHFGQEYLGSLSGMDHVTRAVIAVFHRNGVVPIVESKVRHDEDVAQLRSLLALPTQSTHVSKASADVDNADGGDQGFPHKMSSDNGCDGQRRWSRSVIVSSVGSEKDPTAESGCRHQATASFYPKQSRVRRWASKA